MCIYLWVCVDTGQRCVAGEGEGCGGAAVQPCDQLLRPHGLANHRLGERSALGRVDR